MPIQQMYLAIPPNPNSRHQLTEYLSKRGESKLEAFHDRLANFANSGMRDSLSDNLHLAGTARYNLSIRHKRALLLTHEKPTDGSIIAGVDDRKLTPDAWEKIVPYYNHTELWYINQMAADIGCSLPFPKAEKLPDDNGERFFSKYMTIVRPGAQKYNDDDECLCKECADLPAMTDVFPRQNAIAHSTTAILTPTVTCVAVNQQQNNFRTPPAPLPPPPPTIHQYQQQQMWIPIQPMLPMYFVPPPLACCNRYMQWTQRRIGRPPHDLHCQQRGAVNNSTVAYWAGIDQTRRDKPF
jgi:hypothetical protein